jgi:hypothetical protein
VATIGFKIVVGIPVTSSELAECLVNPRGRDLISSSKMTMQNFTQAYTRQIVDPFTKLAPTWIALGARVYTGATLRTLAQALDDGPTRVLVILSHWVDGPSPTVEFFDGMTPIADVAEILAADFEGVVDLCICQSLELARLISSRCPRALVKWINVPATPVVWLYALTLILRIMSDEDAPYMYAADKALRSFQDAI